MTIVRPRTPAGEAIVILPEAEFERLRELTGVDPDAPRAAPAPLAFRRAGRGRSLRALAQTGAVGVELIAAMGRGDLMGEPAVYARPAQSLDADVEGLVSPA